MPSTLVPAAEPVQRPAQARVQARQAGVLEWVPRLVRVPVPVLVPTQVRRAALLVLERVQVQQAQVQAQSGQPAWAQEQ